ncbi:hypothetical protein GXP70_01545 [Paenibacillus lycopersici]|uniref:Uncharacterized protein n=1 Tax=Paenibacillus lycopersici TaxID=2704462 RepID=A0A6C0FX61_9BACL|nr:hypothetical protein [Paenibacillus lycopersici]QHT58790.1 hypothetical protein GXP70_01545 [Paenibacillus lycopersici]
MSSKANTAPQETKPIHHEVKPSHHPMKPIYQCDDNVHQTLRNVHDQLHRLCTSHMHRLVKVELMDGDVFEGHIVHCDKGILVICLNNEYGHRGFFPGPVGPNFNNYVLPLVLFNLLAISLL